MISTYIIKSETITLPKQRLIKTKLQIIISKARLIKETFAKQKSDFTPMEFQPYRPSHKIDIDMNHVLI